MRTGLSWPCCRSNTREESNLWKGFAENSIQRMAQVIHPARSRSRLGFRVSQNTSACLRATYPLPSSKQLRLRAISPERLTDKFSVSYPIRLELHWQSRVPLVSECQVFSGWANRKQASAFIRNGCQPLRTTATRSFLALRNMGSVLPSRSRKGPQHSFRPTWHGDHREHALGTFESMGIPFQYPKPKELLRYLILIGTGIRWAPCSISLQVRLDSPRSLAAKRG